MCVLIKIGNQSVYKGFKPWDEEYQQKANEFDAYLQKEIKRIEKEVVKILKQFAMKPFIFNLSHGIMPKTPLKNVTKLIKLVRSYKE